MGIPSDEVVLIRPPESAGEPSLITISCPDKFGLGCDLCREILLFGLSIVRGDVSKDGKWCFILFWVVEKSKNATRWELLKKRLLAACPTTMTFDIDNYSSRQHEIQLMLAGELQQPKLYMLKVSCYDRMGLLHDVTEVLCEQELRIRNVKVSTTPDGRVMDLFFITDIRELLHTKGRRDEICAQLLACLGDSMSCCSIEVAKDEISACLLASSSLPFLITEEMFNQVLPNEPPSGCSSSYDPSVTMDNSLSPSHSLLQIECHDHKGVLYDIMRTLKDYKMQISYGRFNATQTGNCQIDLFVVQTDGKKIFDQHKQNALCSRLRMELSQPLQVTMVSRGPDVELLVANPIESCGKGRPLVFYDITLALKMLQICIFSAEIGRHIIGDREWEIYRIHLGDHHELLASRNKIVEKVTNMLMGWD